MGKWKAIEAAKSLLVWPGSSATASLTTTHSGFNFVVRLCSGVSLPSVNTLVSLNISSWLTKKSESTCTDIWKRGGSYTFFFCHLHIWCTCLSVHMQSQSTVTKSSVQQQIDCCSTRAFFLHLWIQLGVKLETFWILVRWSYHRDTNVLVFKRFHTFVPEQILLRRSFTLSKAYV